MRVVDSVHIFCMSWDIAGRVMKMNIFRIGPMDSWMDDLTILLTVFGSYYWLYRDVLVPTGCFPL